MSVEAVLARVQALQSAFAPPAPATPTPASTSSTSNSNSFAGMLQGAMGSGSLGATSAVAPIAGASGTGAAIVAAAAGEVGQAESPPGSNNSPRIAMYRQATAGNSGVGPWCAYFTSWACKQAGVPLMDGGTGSGSVDAIYSWAQKTGRAQPASSSYTPQPGDLIVFHEHIGIVENVQPDGTIQTIEGNSSDRVSRRTHPRSDAIGFVRTG